MGKEMEDRKVGELTLGFELKGVDEPQPRLDEAAGHIAAACEILVSLAGGVEIGADVIACDTTSRSGDSSSEDLEVEDALRDQGVNGYAGIPGHAINVVRMYYVTPSGERYKQAWCRPQTTARTGWLGVVCDDESAYGGDDHAGIYGEPLDRLQVCITDGNPY